MIEMAKASQGRKTFLLRLAFCAVARNRAVKCACIRAAHHVFVIQRMFAGLPS
jgi:hypothetical protein